MSETGDTLRGQPLYERHMNVDVHVNSFAFITAHQPQSLLRGIFTMYVRR